MANIRLRASSRVILGCVALTKTNCTYALEGHVLSRAQLQVFAGTASEVFPTHGTGLRKRDLIHFEDFRQRVCELLDIVEIL